ncbi:YwhD family protein [Alicyclobacillus fodiniaquatilis]|uniref:YwhD family protein n=1 Tax=Alicyclobacillus fodiniaquatilis TaxID=1661150 RepID=A0ABW4JM61_9BACL
MQKLSLTGKAKHQTDDQMKGLSAVLVDGDDIFVDNGAIHAKSRLEVGIQFVKSLDEVPNARHIQGLWITLKRQENGLGFTGAMPFDLWIDAGQKIGYKKLSEQVNNMDKAVRGMVDLSKLEPSLRMSIGQYLQKIRPDLWENASADFRHAFALDEK